jgi:hypothetical protein
MSRSLGSLGYATGVTANATTAVSLSQCANASGVAVNFSDFFSVSVGFVYADNEGSVSLIWGDQHSDTAIAYGNSRFSRITVGKNFYWWSENEDLAQIYYQDTVGNVTIIPVDGVYGTTQIYCRYLDPFNEAISSWFYVDVGDGIY